MSTTPLVLLSAESAGQQMTSKAIASVGHHDHARECRDRVRGYLYQLRAVYDTQMMDDTIRLAREALALSPNEDSDRIDACLLLASALFQRCDVDDDIRWIEEAIAFEREVLAFCGEGHPDRARCCGRLATSLRTYYERGGDDSLLEEAIDLNRESLALHPEGHPDRAMSCGNLAASLGTLYELTGDDHLLDECIQLERGALALRPDGHPQRALSCGNLAAALTTCYEYNGDDGILVEVIDLEREALALRSHGHPARASSCGNLAVSLKTRYECTGDDRLLDESINLQREALALRPRGHPKHAMSCGNLAVSLQTRYESTGDRNLLVEAISLEREALSLRPVGHPARPSSCGNLALWLRTLHDCTGGDNLLNESISLQREALELRPPGHPDRAMSCESLAVALTKRYVSTGDDSLLSEAIGYEREALALRTGEHPDRASSCGSLAASLTKRYERTGDDRLLVEAIHLEREALALRPDGHPYRAMSCGNLAASLSLRYERTRDHCFLDEAIDLQREALALYPSGHPQRARSCGDLACSLGTRYKSIDDDRLLDEAIDLERESLSLCSEGHPSRALYCGNMATSLITRWSRTGDDSLLADIFNLLNEAILDAPVHRLWTYFSNLSWLHLRQSSSFYDVREAILCLSKSLENIPDDISAAALVVVASIDVVWYHNVKKQRTELTAVYQRFVDLLPLLANSTLEIGPQLHALRKCSRVGSDAFVNAALAENWTSGLEILELAQGVIWSQSLHHRDPQLREVPASLAKRLGDHLRAMTMGSEPVVRSREEAQTLLTPRDLLHSHSSQAYAIIREIRTLPGLNRFMQGESFKTLSTVASVHPVVVLVGARGHYYALIIASSLPRGHMLLTLDMTDENASNISVIFGATRSSRGAELPEDSSSAITRLSLGKHAPRRPEPLHRHLKSLWLMIVKPVLDHLSLEPLRGQNRPRLYWCPTGIFSSIPLHAAGIYDGTQRVSCADYVVSSYTPTVTALLRARRAVTSSLHREDLSIAFLAEKRAHDRALQVIHGVDEEIDQAASVAKTNDVAVIHQQAGTTTVADTAAVIQTANIVHLACHGIQDIGDATQSGFCLGDGRLTIAKLMELKLDNAFLAFLSACETAKGDKQQPDQAMHLAAAMLFSGFKSVVATMWAISDVDGPKVAKWFYEELFAKYVVDADSVAYALDFAVGQLRDSGVSPNRWAPFIHMGA